jgi:hypothetical protein
MLGAPSGDKHGDGHSAAVATLCFTLIALILAGPAVSGRATFGPDKFIDWDPLYRTGPPLLPPWAPDLTPIVIDFPRELAFARGLHKRRLGKWNPP